MIDLGYNERRLLEILRGKGGMSRIELAREMDVSAPTLTRLTANLLKSGLILEAEEARNDGKRGNPPPPSRSIRTGFSRWGSTSIQTICGSAWPISTAR